MKNIRRVLSIVIMLAVVITFAPLAGGQVYAATKSPAAPKITSAQELTTNMDDFKIVVVKWAKAKNAKSYQTAIRSTSKKWVKVKTVKKTAANKKKYTKKNQYKVVAKGKNYIVYQYQYTYTKMGTTKSCSYRFTDAPDWEDLQPDTTYTFAVRSVNGKKYSAWKTVSLRTSGPSWIWKTLTSSGESLTQSIEGNNVTMTIGKQSAFPVPDPNGGIVKAKPVTIIPSYIEYYFVRDEYTEDIRVEGKTPDGLSAVWTITLKEGACDTVRYSLKDPTFNENYSKYTYESFGSGMGHFGRKYIVNDPNVKVVWTLDGTEPRLGQADKIIDASEYPFGQVKTYQGAVYEGSLIVRGSADSSKSSSLWRETTIARDPEWIKVYNGTTLVEEEFSND